MSPPPESSPRRVLTPTLEIAYEESGDPAGEPIVLLHGFPYDPRCFDGVVPLLTARGVRVIVPFLRGYGLTRFRDDETLRSGQQGALGQDLVDFLDALDLDRALLAGFDWGGRAACIVSALHPDRVTALVSVGGYAIQDPATASDPESPDLEKARWYQHYFQHEIGRRALEDDRDELLAFLWATWSPTWSDATVAFPASAPSFRNPDFVDVAIHSYRHRFGNVDGDPAYDEIESSLGALSSISVPSVLLIPDADGIYIHTPDAAIAEKNFTGPVETIFLRDTGHNPAQEDPVAFADAVLRARAMAAGETETAHEGVPGTAGTQRHEE